MLTKNTKNTITKKPHVNSWVEKEFGVMIHFFSPSNEEVHFFTMGHTHCLQECKNPKQVCCMPLANMETTQIKGKKGQGLFS